MTAEFVVSSPDVMQCPQHHLPEYAFIGRSNVGKSSLINMITEQPGLAKTSAKPGKTLLINHFYVNPQGGKSTQEKTQGWYLVDLPGYGFARTGKTQREQLRKMIERYCLLRQPLISLFVLVDSRHEPQQIDLEFMEWLGEQEIPFAIVFTKIDKLGKQRLQENLEAYKQKLYETWESLPPIFLTSSEKRAGAAELLAYIEEINGTI